MKKIIMILTLVVTSFVLVGCKKPDLYIYMPNEYIDEAIIKSFQKEYGVKVSVKNFNSNEVALEQIKKNPNSFDIIIPSDYAIEELAALDLIEKIDWTQIPSMEKSDLSRDLLTYVNTLKLEGFDVLDYAVPYFWGSIGLLYNHNISGLAERVQNEEWSILADQSLNTMIYDSSRDAFMIALAHLGIKLSEATQADINLAKDWLISAKGPKTSIKSDQILDEAVGNRTPYDVAVVYSGDATYILQENENYSYYNPSFTNVWVDGMVIHKNVKNKDLAYKFIDWIVSYDNHFDNTVEVGYTAIRQDVLEAVLEEEFDDERIIVAFLVEGIDQYEFFRYNTEIFNMITDAWSLVRTS